MCSSVVCFCAKTLDPLEKKNTRPGRGFGREGDTLPEFCASLGGRGTPSRSCAGVVLSLCLYLSRSVGLAVCPSVLRKVGRIVDCSVLSTVGRCFGRPVGLGQSVGLFESVRRFPTRLVVGSVGLLEASLGLLGFETVDWPLGRSLHYCSRSVGVSLDRSVPPTIGRPCGWSISWALLRRLRKDGWLVSWPIIFFSGICRSVGRSIGRSLSQSVSSTAGKRSVGRMLPRRARTAEVGRVHGHSLALYYSTGKSGLPHPPPLLPPPKALNGVTRWTGTRLTPVPPTPTTHQQPPTPPLTWPSLLPNKVPSSSQYHHLHTTTNDTSSTTTNYNNMNTPPPPPPRSFKRRAYPGFLGQKQASSLAVNVALCSTFLLSPVEPTNKRRTNERTNEQTKGRA